MLLLMLRYAILPLKVLKKEEAAALFIISNHSAALTSQKVSLTIRIHDDDTQCVCCDGIYESESTFHIDENKMKGESNPIK